MINKIIQGDCLEVMKDIPDKSIDMILCDLPYGTTACKWDTIIPFEPLWAEYERVIKDNGAIILTASQPFTSALIMSNPKIFKYEWIWDKGTGTNFMSVKREPLRQHEQVLVFGKGKINYNPQPTELSSNGKSRNNRKNHTDHKKTETIYGDVSKLKRPDYTGKTIGYPKTILRYNREQNNQYKKQVFHPTQKPVALFEYLIKTYTTEGEIVLDNCIGSGTTAVAAIQNGRNFIGIEKDPDYARIARERVHGVLV